MKTLDATTLAAVSGGMVNWGSIYDAIKRGTTVPLGPYYPPRSDQRWIANGHRGDTTSA